MFIECSDGSYFNADKAICYVVNDFKGFFAVTAKLEDGDWILGVYKTKDRAKAECRKVVEWIRSTAGLEASSKEYLNKFIYRMPEEDKEPIWAF